MILFKVKSLNPKPNQKEIKILRYEFLENGEGYSKNYEKFISIEKGDKLEVEYDSIKYVPSILSLIEGSGVKHHPPGAESVKSIKIVSKV